MIVLSPVVGFVTFGLDKALEPLSQGYLIIVFGFLLVVPEAAVGSLLLSSFRKTSFSDEFREDLLFKYITLFGFFALLILFMYVLSLAVSNPMYFAALPFVGLLMGIWFPICLLYIP